LEEKYAPKKQKVVEKNEGGEKKGKQGKRKWLIITNIISNKILVE
jgi:hypothetical protein